MPPGRDDKVEAERDCMSFPETSWVVTDKVGLGLGSVYSPVGRPAPAPSTGSLPGLRLVSDEDETTGRGDLHLQGSLSFFFPLKKSVRRIPRN